MKVLSILQETNGLKILVVLLPKHPFYSNFSQNFEMIVELKLAKKYHKDICLIRKSFEYCATRWSFCQNIPFQGPPFLVMRKTKIEVLLAMKRYECIISDKEIIEYFASMKNEGFESNLMV